MPLSARSSGGPRPSPPVPADSKAENSSSADDGDEAFRAFLEEVDKLSVGDGASDGGCGGGDEGGDAEAEGEGRGTRRDRGLPERLDLGAEASAAEGKGADGSRGARRRMIENASDGQRAWAEFQKVDLSKEGGGAEGSGKVSFQIKSSKDAKKNNQKKKEKKQIANDGDDAPGSEATNDADELGNECPSWTLVVDTCSLLEDDGRGVRKLIHVARRANAAHLRARDRRNPPAASATVDEPIYVVIPFQVWSELEHRSKSEDPKKAYAARASVRMLREELKLEAASDAGQRDARAPRPEASAALRAQSLAESREAASRFLPGDAPSTGDDRVLACVLAERERRERGGGTARGPGCAAGGAVVLTADGNLTCKAYANGLRVDAPDGFRKRYSRRMTSLRERAAGATTGGKEGPSARKR